jgi:hypothetical protein
LELARQYADRVADGKDAEWVKRNLETIYF